MIRAVREEDTPEGVLKEMLSRVEHFNGVIVIALNKDKSQFMMSSMMDSMEKSYLLAFAQSWLLGLFEHLHNCPNRPQ